MIINININILIISILLLLFNIIVITSYYNNIEKYTRYGINCFAITTVTPSISSEINMDGSVKYEIFKFIHNTSGDETVYEFKLHTNIIADILIVGGGGGGGHWKTRTCGGGGGGGVLYMVDKVLQKDITYKITVGDGGSGGVSGSGGSNTSGYDSSIKYLDSGDYVSFDGIDLLGKGGGTAHTDGGSGGGGNFGGWYTRNASQQLPGNATQGLTFWDGTRYIAGGFAGGAIDPIGISGGGGGASMTGGTDCWYGQGLDLNSQCGHDIANGNRYKDSHGGHGHEVNITGVSLFYGGGGSGGGCFTFENYEVDCVGGNGGKGGGGRSSGFRTNGDPGTPDTGGGGGSFYSDSFDNTSGKGGSGIVIIRKKRIYRPCLAPVNPVNSILVDIADVSHPYDDIYKKIILSNDGSNQQNYEVNFLNDTECDILIVGGGGGGHGGMNTYSGGGGGGGGILYARDIQVTSGIYTFKVGKGGTGEKTISEVVLTPPENGFPSEALGAIAYGGNAGRKVSYDDILYGGRGGTTNIAFTTVSPNKFNRYNGGDGGTAIYQYKRVIPETTHPLSGGDGQLIDIIGPHYWGGGGGGGGKEYRKGDGGSGGGGAGGFYCQPSHGAALGGTSGINTGDDTSHAIAGNKPPGGNAGQLTGGGGGGAYQANGGNGGSGSIIIIYKCVNSNFQYPCVTPVNSILVDMADVSLPYYGAYKRIILSNDGSDQQTYQVKFSNNMKIDILIVGGGGGGNGGREETRIVGGGGGGGGILYASDIQVTSGIYTFKVGRGGTGDLGSGAQNGFPSEAFSAIAHGGGKGRKVEETYYRTEWYGGEGGIPDITEATQILTPYNGGHGGTGTKSYDSTDYSLSGADGQLIDIVGTYYWGGGGGGGGWYTTTGAGGQGGGGGGGHRGKTRVDPALGGIGINNGGTSTNYAGNYGCRGSDGGELTGGGGGGAYDHYGGNGGSGSIIIVYKCTA